MRFGPGSFLKAFPSVFQFEEGCCLPEPLGDSRELRLAGLLGACLPWQQWKCIGGGLLSWGKTGLDHMLPPAPFSTSLSPHTPACLSPGHSAISLSVHPHAPVCHDAWAFRPCACTVPIWETLGPFSRPTAICHLILNINNHFWKQTNKTKKKNNHFWEPFLILQLSLQWIATTYLLIQAPAPTPHPPPLHVNSWARVGSCSLFCPPLSSPVSGPAHSRCSVNICWIMLQSHQELPPCFCFLCSF